MKTCKNCNLDKADDQFGRVVPKGFQGWCKDCLIMAYVPQSPTLTVYVVKHDAGKLPAMICQSEWFAIQYCTIHTDAAYKAFDVNTADVMRAIDHIYGKNGQF